jgi:putative transposase
MSARTHNRQPTSGSEARPQVRIAKELLDQILANYSKPEDLTGSDGILKQVLSAVVNRAMQAEMSHHLGYESGQTPPEEQSNRRNGHSKKILRSDQGDIELSVPRDREGSFEPQLVKKHQRHFNGFDDKILAMYARGMSVRDIRAHLDEVYGVDVSPDLISHVTDAVVDELKAWQSRPLEALYMVVYLDALVVKMRDKGGSVMNKSVYLVVGVHADGTKDVLGLWIAPTEGAKFWLSVLTDLRQRGVQDILVLCADGLKGLPEAVEAAFPQTIFQTCIVHMVRSSTRFVPWKERKAVCADLKQIYGAENVDTAELALLEFEEKWGARYPMIVSSWRTRWAEITPFLAFPPEIRRAIYTTNAIEALNRQLRKVLKTKGALPSDDAAAKLLYLALRNAKKTWGGRQSDWTQALLQFAIHFEGRITL